MGAVKAVINFQNVSKQINFQNVSGLNCLVSKKWQKCLMARYTASKLVSLF